MLGELIFEKKGTTSGIRVLSSEGGEVEVEVNLKTEGKILGVEETSMWTYTSKTRADGSIYGEGTGFMTTESGYFHSQIFPTVLPCASTSYSTTPAMEFKCAYFSAVVWK